MIVLLSFPASYQASLSPKGIKEFNWSSLFHNAPCDICRSLARDIGQMCCGDDRQNRRRRRGYRNTAENLFSLHTSHRRRRPANSVVIRRGRSILSELTKSLVTIPSAACALQIFLLVSNYSLCFIRFRRTLVNCLCVSS